MRSRYAAGEGAQRDFQTAGLNGVFGYFCRRDVKKICQWHIFSVDLSGYAAQPVKERQFSLCESWRFSRIKEEIGQKNKEIRAAPLPEGQFFEIHSSIFKPHPC